MPPRTSGRSAAPGIWRRRNGKYGVIPPKFRSSSTSTPGHATTSSGRPWPSYRCCRGLPREGRWCGRDAPVGSTAPRHESDDPITRPHAHAALSRRGRRVGPVPGSPGLESLIESGSRRRGDHQWMPIAPRTGWCRRHGHGCRAEQRHPYSPGRGLGRVDGRGDITTPTRARRRSAPDARSSLTRCSRATCEASLERHRVLSGFLVGHPELLPGRSCPPAHNACRHARYRSDVTSAGQ
ncbi:hypothetical protein HUW46_09380 [Amycolatopsis sp. CA-230715]|nr:hypothetical protein HUW46_09380 [Amycolatopsis sp. CA-230715]